MSRFLFAMVVGLPAFSVLACHGNGPSEWGDASVPDQLMVPLDLGADFALDLLRMPDLHPSPRPCVAKYAEGPRQPILDRNGGGLTYGDIDGDGIADVLASVGAVPTFKAYLGKGDGSFRAPVSGVISNLGGQFDGWVAREIDGDGRLDLFVWTTTGVSIALGDGKGNFTQSSQIALGPNDGAFVPGDFNGDGSLDLLVSRDVVGPSDEVYEMDNDGHGNFHQTRLYAMVPKGQSLFGWMVASGNRAIPDWLVWISWDGVKVDMGPQHLVAHGRLVEGFDFAANGLDYWGMDAADLDGDGRDEIVFIVTGNYRGQQLQAGGLIFAAGLKDPIVLNSFDRIEGDVNGDHIADLLVDVSKMVCGNGDLTFSPTAPTGAYFLNTVNHGSQADFNNDGLLDYVAVANDQSYWSVFLSQP